MITRSQEETIEAGIEFAGELSGGEVIALTGDLGSGKTTFLKGLAEGLMVEDTITSPTFVLLKSYPGKIKRSNINFVHIDAYRTDSIEDIKSVGIEDFLGRKDVIMAVEWAEKIKEILPKKIIKINFKTINENNREVKIQ